MNLIEKIRQKPIEQRIKYIWISAVVACIIMIIAWILIGNFHYQNVDTKNYIKDNVQQFKDNKTSNNGR